MSERVERARMLLRVRRFEESAKESTLALSEEPEDFEALALLGFAQLGLGRSAQAVESARRAVASAPEAPYAHWALGTVLSSLDRDEEALSSAREAIRLAPEDPDFAALEAQCQGGLSRWKEMLASAERGLSLDPTHTKCLNLRAHALRLLGRTEEAAEGLALSLTENPEDADAHTAPGWTKLQAGDVQAAMVHFREALRIEPDDESARSGLVEALKARNPLYRPILWWLLWTSRVSRKQFLIVFFGTMFGTRALRQAGKENEALEGVAIVVGLLYALAMWTSWVGAPLFDFLLYLRRDTRDVLPPDDRLVAKCVGGTVLAAPVAALLFVVLGDPLGILLAPLAFLAVAVPVSGSMKLANRIARRIGMLIAAGCVVLALAGCALHAQVVLQGSTAKEEPVGAALLACALFLAAMSTWALMGLGLVKARR